MKRSREDEEKDKKEQRMDNGKGEDSQGRETIKNKTGKGTRRGMKALERN